MDFLWVKHDDISKMTMDEKRALKVRLDKMKKTAVKISSLFLAPVAMLTVTRTTKFVLQTLWLNLDYGIFKNIYPALLLVALTLSLTKMKRADFKGYVITVGLYFSLLLVSPLDVIYSELFLLSFIPMLFIIRYMLNFKTLNELKNEPGYPLFIYTVSEKFAGDTYLRDGIQGVDEDYTPWNAFGNSDDKNENSDLRDGIQGVDEDYTPWNAFGNSDDKNENSDSDKESKND